MMEGKAGGDFSPPDIHIQHEEPPMFYCWKYYMPDGTLREGCTEILPGPENSWPDLNLYGWIYIAIPLAILFILAFLFSCCCRSGKNKQEKTVDSVPLMSDSVSEISETTYGVPMRLTSRQNEIYNMVPYPQPPTGYKAMPTAPDQKLYPNLTTKQHSTVDTNGRVKNATVQPKAVTNEYVDRPKHKKKEPAPPADTESEYSDTESEDDQK